MVQPSVFEPVEFDPFAPAPEAAAALAPAGVRPLTSMQRELYAAVQMGPQAHAAFLLTYALHLSGPLEQAAWERALSATVQRHAALRVRLLAHGQGQVVQEAPFDGRFLSPLGGLSRLDFSALTRNEQDAALAELVIHECTEPMDLHQAPLWRAHLISRSLSEHVFVFAVHHLVFDGWSSTVFFADLAAAYRADRFGIVTDWPVVSPYEAYVEGQISDSHRALEQQSMAYWKAQHLHPAVPLGLPIDRPRPAFKTYACDHERLELPSDLVRSVRQMGARQGCTLFVTLLAAFQGLLARLSGANDIVVGVPMAVQTTLEVAHLVANGAQTVPLRCETDVNRPFSEHLREIKAKVLDAQTHLHCSFGLLVHPLQLPRDSSRTPLVDVIFNVDRGGAAFDFGELRLQRVDTPKQFSNAELSFNVLDDGLNLAVEVHYLSALYDGVTLRGWLLAYQSALERLSLDPERSLAQAYEPPGEDALTLQGFNATDCPFDSSTRLEQRFAQQTLSTPDSPALWFDDKPYSYRHIDEWANGIAQSLIDFGVAVGDRVGIACARGPQTLAAVLGVMKSGAAYVPLDMAYPDQRLKMMVEDAALKVALGESGAQPAWAEGTLRWLPVQGCQRRAQGPLLNAGALSAQAAAYVIFTSGSTGRPKGVVVAHAAVMNYLGHLLRTPGLHADDRLAAVTTLSFDMSVTELFLPMLAGASLVMMTHEEVRDPAQLASRLRSSAVTTLQAAPSIWKLLLELSGSLNSLDKPLKAWSGGEALSRQLAADLQSHCAQLWNLYGPTETTVFSVIGRVSGVDGAIRVGRPIANTQVHVVDQQLRHVPLGAVGEICIGGAGVALGYLGQPEKTAERFVADPWRPGQRLFRTGDVGRWHRDGTLECLGRLDHQIKLRGHRIELDEIDRALHAAGAQDCLTTLHRFESGDDELVTYLVTSRAAEMAPADEQRWVRELRDQLKALLPQVMIPAHFVWLPRWPLLPNGKVNRAALPAPQVAQPAQAALTDAAEASPQQRAIAEIWRRHLGGTAAALRAQDNFFDLGGHSLLAARVSADMEAALGWRIGVPRLIMESLSQLAQGGEPVMAPKPPVSQPLAAWLRRWGAVIRGS